MGGAEAVAGHGRGAPEAELAGRLDADEALDTDALRQAMHATLTEEVEEIVRLIHQAEKTQLLILERAEEQGKEKPQFFGRAKTMGGDGRQGSVVSVMTSAASAKASAKAQSDGNPD